MSIVYTGVGHVKHGFHHLKCDNMALRFFFDVFLNLSIPCMMLVSHTKSPFFITPHV
jgi:hypothetical protein